MTWDEAIRKFIGNEKTYCEVVAMQQRKNPTSFRRGSVKKTTLIIILLIIPIATALNNPFDKGWLEQINRPKIELCTCQLDNKATITGNIINIEWIKPYCDGNKCWGIQYKYNGSVCMLPDTYNEGCFLTEEKK
jgi:hypothetical protein